MYHLTRRRRKKNIYLKKKGLGEEITYTPQCPSSVDAFVFCSMSRLNSISWTFLGDFVSTHDIGL